MNELAMVFDRMGIDTAEVVDGMNTKWNALGFRPGLVGGHCIGVDPYYFTYEAEKLGYHSQIILNGRIVNDGMGAFIAEATVKQLILAGKAPKKARVAIFGLTFKVNNVRINFEDSFMLIWTVKEGEPLPLPECPGRIMRCGIISQMLSDRGNTVIWWTSAYFHQKKCLLREAECVEKIKPNYLVHLLRPRILYKHNISIKRALYSLELSRLFRKAAESEEKPDLIYCSYPLIDLAYEVVKYAKVNNVPVVIDIRDLWPDIFYSSVPPIIKPVAKIAFHAEERKATYCVKNADMVECKYHAKYYHLSLVKDSSRIALWAERKGITSYKDNECAAIYCQGNYEEYLSGLSKNVRQNLRTANNRTVTDGREVALVVYNEEPVPEELIQKLCLLYEKRRMIKNQTMNRSHLQYRFTECIRRRNLKKYDITTEAMRSGRGFYLGVLFIDGIPAAFCFGPKSTDGTLCFMQVAIDDMFDRYSPGMLLLTRVFESMLNESGILSIDLTNGNETYKFLLGAKSHYTKCYVFVQ